MKTFLLTAFLLFSPLATLAAGVLSLGEGGSLQYTDEVQKGNTTLYYNTNTLVASADDADGNGKADVWLKYQNDAVVLEAHDTDGDGTPDAFFQLGANEQVTRQYGSGIDALQRPEAESFDSLIKGTGEDLVGDLSDITIPGGGIGWLWWVLILGVLAGGGFWWVKRKK